MGFVFHLAKCNSTPLFNKLHDMRHHQSPLRQVTSLNGHISKPLGSYFQYTATSTWMRKDTKFQIHIYMLLKKAPRLAMSNTNTEACLNNCMKKYLLLQTMKNNTLDWKWGNIKKIWHEVFLNFWHTNITSRQRYYVQSRLHFLFIRKTLSHN